MTQLISGRYEAVRLLGTGASGHVLEVHDRVFGGAPLALKRLPAAHADLALDEFRRLRAFHYPGIPRAYELGCDAETGALFFTAELGRGEEFIAALRGAGLPEQVRAVADLLRTLVLLAERGIVHRDLKPTNLLVERDGVEPRVLLLDFGLATAATSGRALAGSLPYLAPELFTGASATHGTDLYALGIVLHELWAGRHPFHADSPTEWARCHREQPVRFADDGGLPASLQRLVQKLLAKTAAERYALAADVLTDLSRASPTPLPRSTPRTLRGRVLSVPRFDPPWREQPPSAAPDVPRPGGAVTWVNAPTRSGRDELMRDLRAEAVTLGALPLVVRLGEPAAGTWPPRVALLNQLRAVLGAAAAVDDAELFAALRQGGGGRRFMLFLEDMDARTTEQEAIVRLLLQAPVEVVIAAATAPADDALVAALVPGGALRRLEPRPIEPAELARHFPTWLGCPLPPELARFLGADRGLDVPWLVATLAYLVDSGALRVEEGTVRLDLAAADLAHAGGDLLEIVRRRLRLLRPEARDLLAAVAVLERPASAAQVAALVPAATRALLDQLGDEGFLERDGAQFRCASGSIAAATLSACDARTLAQLHGLAAEVVERDGETPDRELRIARHRFRAQATADRALAWLARGLKLVDSARFAEAGEIAAEVGGARLDGDTAAAVQLLEGCVQLRRNSFEQAERTLAEAHRHLADPTLAARAVAEHARAMERLGRYADALAALDAAAPALWERHPPAVAQRAYLLHLLQRDVEAEAACRQALIGLGTAPTAQHVRLLNIHATLLWRLGQSAPARAEFEAGIAAARALEMPVAAAGVAGNLGRLEEDLGRLDAAAVRFREALEIAALYGDRELEALVAFLLAQTLFDLGRLPEAKHELARAREVLHAMHRAPQDRRRVALLQAQVALAEGEPEAALQVLDESRQLAESVGDARGVFLAELVRADVWLRQGRLADVRGLQAELERRAAEQHQPELSSYVAEYRLSHAAFVGSRTAVGAALAALPEPPASGKRRLQLLDARLRALGRLGDAAALGVAADAAAAALEGTDLVALRAHALARRCEAAIGRCTADEVARFAAAARTALHAVVAPGHAWRKAEAELVLGRAIADGRLLADAERLAAVARHEPLRRLVLRARRRLALPESTPADAALLESLLRLKEAAKIISATTDGDLALKLLLDHTIEATRARRGFLILTRGGRISVPVARNIDADDIANPEFAVSSSVARAVAADGRSCQLSDVTADERFRHASSISQLKLVSVLCVPLRSHGELVGSLYLDDPTRIDAFDGTHVRYAEELAEFAAIALEKAQLLRANEERQRELERANQELAQTKREVERLNAELQRTVAFQSREISEVKESLKKTRAELALRHSYGRIVAQSTAMHEVLRKLDLFTESDSSVFITGESGTGKELVARTLHENGPRKERRFMTVNCASVAQNLIENELFGHAKGAFTGAVTEEPGLFELADGGTLFMDEICEAAPDFQVKLLRAVQFGEVQRVGGGMPRRVDVRIIAASNKEVAREVAAGRFREDLMYRLNVLTVHLPPLRSRRDDIPLLIEHFVRKHDKQGRRSLVLSPAVWKRIHAHEWPGNIRELQNFVTHALVFARPGEELSERDLPEGLLAATGGALPTTARTLKSATDETERAAVREALERHGGNRVRAARDLDISERALYLKLARFGGSGTREAGRGGNGS